MSNWFKKTSQFEDSLPEEPQVEDQRFRAIVVLDIYATDAEEAYEVAKYALDSGMEIGDQISYQLHRSDIQPLNQIRRGF